MTAPGLVTTKDPRICIANHGPQNWRTVVQDEPGGDWGITGPPYPSKAVALGHVDEVLAYYFGELPTRGLLAERIEQALAIAQDPAGFSAPQQVQRMVTALTGGRSGLPGQVTSEDEPDLREHITRLHTRLHSAGKARSDKTQAQMAHDHAEDHWRHGSHSHHHGPNAGAHARPAGWRTGGGVVLLDPADRQLRKPATS